MKSEVFLRSQSWLTACSTSTNIDDLEKKTIAEDYTCCLHWNWGEIFKNEARGILSDPASTAFLPFDGLPDSLRSSISLYAPSASETPSKPADPRATTSAATSPRGALPDAPPRPSASPSPPSPSPSLRGPASTKSWPLCVIDGSPFYLTGLHTLKRLVVSREIALQLLQTRPGPSTRAALDSMIAVGALHFAPEDAASAAAPPFLTLTMQHVQMTIYKETRRNRREPQEGGPEAGAPPPQPESLEPLARTLWEVVSRWELQRSQQQTSVMPSEARQRSYDLLTAVLPLGLAPAAPAAPAAPQGSEGSAARSESLKALAELIVGSFAREGLAGHGAGPAGPRSPPPEPGAGPEPSPKRRRAETGPSPSPGPLAAAAHPASGLRTSIRQLFNEMYPREEEEQDGPGYGRTPPGEAAVPFSQARRDRAKETAELAAELEVQLQRWARHWAESQEGGRAGAAGLGILGEVGL